MNSQVCENKISLKWINIQGTYCLIKAISAEK